MDGGAQGGLSAVYAAAQRDDASTVEALHGLGADINTPTKARDHARARCRCCANDVRSGSQAGVTPLMLAVSERHVEMAFNLLRLGALLDTRDPVRHAPMPTRPRADALHDARCAAHGPDGHGDGVRRRGPAGHAAAGAGAWRRTRGFACLLIGRRLRGTASLHSRPSWRLGLRSPRAACRSLPRDASRSLAARAAGRGCARARGDHGAWTRAPAAGS
jgi:hypothetical protein